MQWHPYRRCLLAARYLRARGEGGGALLQLFCALYSRDERDAKANFFFALKNLSQRAPAARAPLHGSEPAPATCAVGSKLLTKAIHAEAHLVCHICLARFGFPKCLSFMSSGSIITIIEARSIDNP